MLHSLRPKKEPQSANSGTATGRIADMARRNIRGLALLGLATLQVLTIGQTILLTVWVAKLARKPAPTLVELDSGESIAVEARDPFARSPKNITAFVAQTMTQLFSWSSLLPTSESGQPVRDKGVEISGRGLGGLRLPTPSYEQSFALSDESSFRSEFVRYLASLVPRSLFTGGARTVYVINRISDPVEIEKGRWKVDVVATLLTFDDGDTVGKAIPFNKTVYVHAVYPPPLSQAKDDTARRIARARRAGLEIEKIVDLSVE